MSNVLIKHMSSEAKSMQRVADNPDRNPKIREAFQAQHDLFQEVTKMLKAGTDPQHIITLLQAEQSSLEGVVNPTYTQIGRRQAAYSLLELLRAEL